MALNFDKAQSLIKQHTGQLLLITSYASGKKHESLTEKASVKYSFSNFLGEIDAILLQIDEEPELYNAKLNLIAKDIVEAMKDNIESMKPHRFSHIFIVLNNLCLVDLTNKAYTKESPSSLIIFIDQSSPVYKARDTLLAVIQFVSTFLSVGAILFWIWKTFLRPSLPGFKLICNYINTI